MANPTKTKISYTKVIRYFREFSKSVNMVKSEMINIQDPNIYDSFIESPFSITKKYNKYTRDK